MLLIPESILDKAEAEGQLVRIKKEVRPEPDIRCCLRRDKMAGGRWSFSRRSRVCQ